MMTATQDTADRPLPVTVGMADEHEARAALYGVLAHFFLNAPSRELLKHTAAAEHLIDGDGSPLAVAWHALCQAARDADPQCVREEFESIFVSTGRPAVSLYASTYMNSARRGSVLADLRDDLARAGYARATDSTEYEDHLSALCEVMRGMIAEEPVNVAAADAQREFFQRYLAPWFAVACDAIDQSGQAVFYRPVARFANAFFTNESAFFELA